MRSVRSNDFSCVGVIGLGLIGGSLALAIKRLQPPVSVIGIDIDPVTLERAKACGAVDVASPDLRILHEADLVILATPIRAILEMLSSLREIVSPDTIVTDTGSTKHSICQSAKTYLPHSFVGGHPMAGSEQQGFAGAHPFMFENALYVLTPLEETHVCARKLALLLERLGAQVLLLEAALHDRLVATISHLPQLIAVALAALGAEKSSANGLYRDLAAGGFRDLTRIASSPFQIWSDILATNAREIDPVLDRFINLLAELRVALTQDDQIAGRFAIAKRFRDTLPRRSKGLLKALHRLAIIVPDQPGALAQVTQIIAAKEISIKDLELLKVREYEAGTFHFYFETEGERERAATALREAGYVCS
jgi:prephenate dehydrogenase